MRAARFRVARRARAARFSLLALLSLLLACSERACAQQPAAPPPAPSPQAAPAPVASDPARVQRLAAQRKAADEQIAAMEKAALEERFLAAVRAEVDALPPNDDEQGPFRVVNGGKVPVPTFTSFLRWSSPRASRELPVALDLVLPNHPYAAIVDFDRQVRARGVDFLLVLLPSRLEIHPELIADLPAGGGFAGMGLATQRFLLALNAAGVESVSLTGPFARARFAADRPPGDPAGQLPGQLPGQLFLRTDPHWTPRGTELAARVVADEIARYPWFEHGPHVEGRDFTTKPQEFGYLPNETLARRGAELEPVTGNCLVKGDELFDALDPASPIVVLGDSFVRVHSMTACDFCSALFRFTGWKIDLIQSYGGAAEQVRRKLARREPAQWQGKKLVVWVVPETLLVTSEAWKRVPLTLPDDK